MTYLLTAFLGIFGGKIACLSQLKLSWFQILFAHQVFRKRQPQKSLHTLEIEG